MLPLYLKLLGSLILLKFGDATPRLSKEVSERLNDYWMLYKTRYNKTYVGRAERHRRVHWEDNLLRIYEHNLLAEAGHYSWTLRDNPNCDLSSQEYLDKLVKLIPSARRQLAADDDEMVAAVLHDPRKIPDQVDWRAKGFVTRPASQRECGSCYAWSVAGCVAGQILKRTGFLVELSEQQLVDCSGVHGNLGCAGGSLRNTLRYLKEVRGIMASASYPYTARQSSCKYQPELSIANVTNWAILPARDERSLEVAVATIGPIAASINASPKSFQLYGQGIYDDESCSSNVVNHAVLIVGYTDKYWILKNWWGSEWGEEGYMRLKKGSNTCGISNYAGYAVI